MRNCYLVFLFCLLPAQLPGATYIGPDLAAILYERDRIPLDTDTMRELSRHLTDLATRPKQEGPEQARATAQLLALAIRLDPANRSALDANKSLREGTRVDPRERDVNRPLRQAWGIAEWLSGPNSGSGGKTLGELIIDALAVINPQSPMADLHDPEGEPARWANIVPAVEAYRETSGPKLTPEVPPPPPPPPPIDRPPILLKKAATKTPLFLYDQNLRRTLQMVPLTMQITDSAQSGVLTFSLDPGTDSPDIATARQNVRRTLEQRWPDLPIEQVAYLSTGTEHYAPNNGQAISGPAALLMHAALSGKSLRNDVVLVAEVGANGSLIRPRQSWSYLRALRIAEGGRLLVAPDFEPELRAMIALEDPSFFLRWEVLIVSSIETAFTLASENSDPTGLAATSQLYEELRTIGKDKDVGQLCVNAKVRERLTEIAGKAPFHYSAKMLLVQGDAAKRPTRVEREVAARILRSTIDPISSISRTSLSQLSVKRLLVAGEAVKAEVARFAKFISPRDEDLLKEAREIGQLALVIGQGKRDGGLQDGVVYYRKTPLPAYHSRLQEKFAALLRKLAPFTGESVRPHPAPEGPSSDEAPSP